MTELGGDKVVGIMKLIIIICTVVVLILWVPGLVNDHRYKVERKARMEEWKKNGISPVTRGSKIDTLEIDTVKLKN